MSDASTSTTLPQSFINAPLTPPQSNDSKPSDKVSQIIEQIRLRKAGVSFPPTGPWEVSHLLASEFKQLLAHLKHEKALWEFVEDKARYDYFSNSHRFILRMPTVTHETFCARIVSELTNQLTALTTGSGEVADFARNIRPVGSPRLEFPIIEGEEEEEGGGEEVFEYDTHEPDAAFQHKDAQWPGVVLEVSYTQKRKDLKYLADDYIVGSNGNIGVVVGLDIEYGQFKRATLSVWRPEYVKEDGQEYLIARQTVMDQEFRTSNGNPITHPNTTSGLDLRLGDFFPAVTFMKSHPVYSNITNQRIFISAATLCDSLTDTEDSVTKIKEKRGVSVSLKAGAKRSKRKRSPTA